MGPCQSLDQLLVWLRDGSTRHTVVRQVFSAEPAGKHGKFQALLARSLEKLLDCQPRFCDQATQRTSCKFHVVGYREGQCGLV
jgi:hypothetical protein